MKPHLAVVLPGAMRYDAHNVNDTWLGTVKLKDGTVLHAFLKDIYAKELANELLGAALASSLNLPVPQTILALAKPDIVPAVKGRSVNGEYRLLFGSERKGSPPLSQMWTGEFMPASIAESLSAWTRGGDAFAFDTWTANIERNLGNLLFGGPRDVWLIDHGECFTGRLWSGDELIPDAHYQNKMASWLIPYLDGKQRESLRSAAWAMQSAVRSLDIDAIAAASLAASILTVRDTEAILAFLKERIEHFPSIAMAQAGNPELLT